MRDLEGYRDSTQSLGTRQPKKALIVIVAAAFILAVSSYCYDYITRLDLSTICAKVDSKTQIYTTGNRESPGLSLPAESSHSPPATPPCPHCSNDLEHLFRNLFGMKDSTQWSHFLTHLRAMPIPPVYPIAEPCSDPLSCAHQAYMRLHVFFHTLPVPINETYSRTTLPIAPFWVRGSIGRLWLDGFLQDSRRVVPAGSRCLDWGREYLDKFFPDLCKIKDSLEYRDLNAPVEPDSERVVGISEPQNGSGGELQEEEKTPGGIEGRVETPIPQGEEMEESDLMKRQQLEPSTPDSESDGAVIYGDVHNLHASGVMDDTYDVILCTQVLEHIERPRAALAELYRVLKPGGKLLMTVPLMVPFHLVPHDYYRYTDEGIYSLLTEAGFVIEQLDKVGNVLTTVAMLEGMGPEDLDMKDIYTPSDDAYMMIRLIARK
ncbi:hypothetical protein HK102_012886 [Quaeritorhiza haematococci]|nr:hypothetical protein HK102_012886 [Quaeritorhiza haematococci]